MADKSPLFCVDFTHKKIIFFNVNFILKMFTLTKLCLFLGRLCSQKFHFFLLLLANLTLFIHFNFFSCLYFRALILAVQLFCRGKMSGVILSVWWWAGSIVLASSAYVYPESVCRLKQLDSAKWCVVLHYHRDTVSICSLQMMQSHRHTNKHTHTHTKMVHSWLFLFNHCV